MSEIKPVVIIKTAEQRIDAFGNFAVTNGAHITVYTDRNKAMLLATKEEADELRAAYEAQAKRIAELEEDLQFVERWANHHGTKPNVTAQEALSCIQHYPSIAEITKSYKDGVIPSTRNPYAEIEALRKQVDEHKEWHMMRDEMRKALEAQKKWR